MAQASPSISTTSPTYVAMAHTVMALYSYGLYSSGSSFAIDIDDISDLYSYGPV